MALMASVPPSRNTRSASGTSQPAGEKVMALSSCPGGVSCARPTLTAPSRQPEQGYFGLHEMQVRVTYAAGPYAQPHLPRSRLRPGSGFSSAGFGSRSIIAFTYITSQKALPGQQVSGILPHFGRTVNSTDCALQGRVLPHGHRVST